MKSISKFKNIQKEIAVKFAGESGLVLRVKLMDKKPESQQIVKTSSLLDQLEGQHEVMKFDCELFSCFAEEKETLFFGGDTVLRIEGIIHCARGKWMRYDKYLEAITVFSRMMNGFSVKNQRILSHQKDQKMMKRIVRDVLRSFLLRLEEAETPKYVHELMLYHFSSANRIQLIYDELATDYKWMDCILKKPSTETVDIANIALLFCHSESITFLMSDHHELQGTDCIILMEDLKLLKRMGVEMTVSFKWPNAVSDVTKNSMRRSGLAPRIRERTMTFTLSNVQIGFEAQEQFMRRIEHLIEQLSTIPTKRKSELLQVNKKKSVELPETTKLIQRTVTKADIDTTLQRAVDGFCRKIMVEVDSFFPNTAPVDVLRLF